MVNEDKLHVWTNEDIENKAQELYEKWNAATNVRWADRSKDLKQDYLKIALRYLNGEIPHKRTYS